MVWLVGVLLVGVGLAGAGRYAWTFWRYRGFGPPAVPSAVTDRSGRTVAVSAATVEHISVPSPALGGRADPVVVVLPPGYAENPRRRYPTVYLLHGVPGRPGDFVSIGDLAATEAALVAAGRLRPAIFVIPSGSPSLLADEEWADGIRPGNDWESFVATDLVRAVDARYRTIPAGAARALAGLSEGGYGALNIGLHHLGEFRVLESWSGYMTAQEIPSVFDHHRALLARNSPAVTVRGLGPAIRADHVFIWFYCGTTDYTVAGNRAFAAELDSLGIAHQFDVEPGAHNWKLWRAMFPSALAVADQRLAHG